MDSQNGAAAEPKKWKPGDAITEKVLQGKKLPIPEKGNKLYYDPDPVGFAVRVTATGQISFVLSYYIRGREHRITIGKYPAWKIAEARNQAEALIETDVKKEVDPLSKRTSDREAPTMKDLADDYFEKFANKSKRPSSLRNDHEMLDGVTLPRLGRKQVAEVSRDDIESLHASLKATPYRANRVLALLSKMFSLAIGWRHRPDNPTASIEHFHEDHRDRWLRRDEIKRLNKALAEYPNQDPANAIRLLLWTGARKTEVLSATWQQFDLKELTWTKPSAHTKQKRTEHVPLSKDAAKLLKRMKSKSDQDEPYVFPGRIKGTHLQDLKNDWKELCKTAKLQDARIHDLRHTYASHLVSSGTPLAIVGKLLGHTQSHTTDRYAHLAESPLRKATDRFGKLIAVKKTAQQGS